MDNPVFSPDAAGFWMWRTKDFCSDKTFPSCQVAMANYEALKAVYENSEVIE